MKKAALTSAEQLVASIVANDFKQSLETDVMRSVAKKVAQATMLPIRHVRENLKAETTASHAD